jgi:hypothetical protein
MVKELTRGVRVAELPKTAVSMPDEDEDGGDDVNP